MFTRSTSKVISFDSLSCDHTADIVLYRDHENVKAFRTRYRALGPELIPMYRQSVRWYIWAKWVMLQECVNGDDVLAQTRRRCGLTREFTRTSGRTRVGIATRRSRRASASGITRTAANRAAGSRSSCRRRKRTTRCAGAAGNASVATPNDFRPVRRSEVVRARRPPSPFRLQPVPPALPRTRAFDRLSVRFGR